MKDLIINSDEYLQYLADCCLYEDEIDNLICLL
jgi:hypothetical protein